MALRVMGIMPAATTMPLLEVMEEEATVAGIELVLFLSSSSSITRHSGGMGSPETFAALSTNDWSGTRACSLRHA